MKHLITLLSICLLFNCLSQTYRDSIIQTRVMKMGELIDTANHILTQDEIDHFEGLAFYEIDTNYRLTALFNKSKGKKFKMLTSTERKPVYRKYGYVEFVIDGKINKLEVYQNMALRRKKEYKDHLFIPFRDATTGIDSYGGGRYLDVKIPKNKTILLDFNTVYNPYCVYSHRYSCPIPPEVNTLSIPIKAGEKVPVNYFKGH